MRILKIVLFAVSCCMIGGLAFRYSVDSVYTYKQPIQNWVNTLKVWKQNGVPSFQDRSKSPIKLQLFYSDSVAKQLNDFVESSLSKGVLTEIEKEKLPGKLVFNSDTLAVKFRLKGDYNDHRKDKHWSYRIYLNKHDDVLGMKTLSLQAPATKGGLYEWLFYKALRHEGFIALQYHFIEFNDNNNRTGLYALEESFDDELLVNNKRTSGVILKLDEQILINQEILGNKNEHHYTRSDLFYIAKIECFKSNRIHKNDSLEKQFNKGKKLLDGFRRGELSLDQAFDVKQTAKLFALADLLGTQHGLMWKNVRFYYNTSSCKLEIISYDAVAGWVFDDVMYNRWRKDKYFGLYADSWFGLFFNDAAFEKKYWKYLKIYSTPDWLVGFKEDNQKTIDQLRGILVGDVSYKEDYFQYFEQNATMIRGILNYRANILSEITPYLIDVNNDAESGMLEIINNSYEDVVLINPITQDSTIIKSRKPNKAGTKIILKEFPLINQESLVLEVNDKSVSIAID
jgi:hypothetical protein